MKGRVLLFLVRHCRKSTLVRNLRVSVVAWLVMKLGKNHYIDFRCCSRASEKI